MSDVCPGPALDDMFPTDQRGSNYTDPSLAALGVPVGPADQRPKLGLLGPYKWLGSILV